MRQYLKAEAFDILMCEKNHDFNNLENDSIVKEFRVIII